MSGEASTTTPALNNSTVFSIYSIALNGCANPSTSTFAVTVNSNGCASVVAGDINLEFPEALCSVGESIQLAASYQVLGSTSSYTVSQIDFCPQAEFNDPTYNQIDLSSDDVWSETITLPFQFCFFNSLYSTCHVGSNGTISFDPAVLPLSGSPWSFATTIPNAGFPIKNAIYGVYQDTDPSNSPSNRAASWKLVGNYPCRKLIVNFYNFGQYSCGQSVGLQTYQMVLYEISNIIEVHVLNRTPCNTWQ